MQALQKALTKLLQEKMSDSSTIETSTTVCKTCKTSSQSDEIWFLTVLCKKYDIKMVVSSSGPFPVGPSYEHFKSVKDMLQGSSMAELLQDYVAKWANDKDHAKKQLLTKIMYERNINYCEDAYSLYKSWVPDTYVAMNPETESEFMNEFCEQFGHLFYLL
jgi:hypothetical protein